MKAVVYHTYGSPDVLRLEDIERPVPADDEVLVRVRAAALNPMDRHFMRGEPFLVRAMIGLRKPKVTRLGVDLAGEVEAVGSRISKFRPGDAVFGACRGAFAEYVCAREERLAPKPANITFEQAAAIPIAGLTALQGLRDKGRIQAGQEVLIVGAGGGVGTFAVQIAKAFGARVTGVCGTGNVDLVRSLGADHVIDHTRDDFTRGPTRYDLIFTVAGSRSLLACRRVMKPKATYAIAGASGQGVIGQAAGVLMTFLLSPLVSQSAALVRTSVKVDDLIFLKELIEANKLTPAIGRRYALREVAEAVRYLEQGHASGKVAITVAEGRGT